jgi:hypothetical protein
MSPFEVVQAMQVSVSSGWIWDEQQYSIAVRWRCRNSGDTFLVRFPANRKIRRVPRGEVKRHPVTSTTVARIRIDDERAGLTHVGR